VKNQYFGDTNDYKKYGLLRILSDGGRFKIAVCWMLTAAVNRGEGKLTRYITQPEKWRAFDQELFDSLKRCLRHPSNRNVRWAKDEDLIPSALFYDEELADDAGRRREYFERFLSAAGGCELVFFDPDNGLEVPTIPFGSRESRKYVYQQEVRSSFAVGHSLLLYQHFPRMKREKFIKGQAAELCEWTGVSRAISFRTSYVAFLLIPQLYHFDYLERQSRLVEERWQPHIQVAHHQCL
jgi:hypothetical protein